MRQPPDSVTLTDILRSGWPLTVAEAVALVIGVGDGVAWEHGPPPASDVLVTSEGEVILGATDVDQSPPVAAFAALLHQLLPEAGEPGAAPVPGALRFTVARALGQVDVAPLVSGRALRQAILRFAPESLEETRAALVRRLAPYYPAAAPPHIPQEHTLTLPERRARPRVDVLRRELLASDLERYELLHGPSQESLPAGPDRSPAPVTPAQSAGASSPTPSDFVVPDVLRAGAARAHAAAAPAAPGGDATLTRPEAPAEPVRNRNAWILRGAAAALASLVLTFGATLWILERGGRVATQYAEHAAPAAEETRRSAESPRGVDETAASATLQTAAPPPAPTAGEKPLAGTRVMDATGVLERAPAVPDSNSPEHTTAAPGFTVDRRGLEPVSTVGPRPLRAPERRGTSVFSPSAAADGRELYFHEQDSAGSRLMRASTTGAGDLLEVATLVDDGFRNYHVRLSPDGSQIAFDSDRQGERAVYVADRNGANLRRVTAEGYAAVPVWSPDGGRLAVVRAEADRPRVWNLWEVDLAGGRERRLTSHRYGQAWPGSWFPDGRRLCYTHEDRIHVLDTATGMRQSYVSPRPSRLVRTPAVSPNGRFVVFQLYRDGMWLLDLTDGSMLRVLDDPSAEEFTWVDARHVAYHSRREGTWGLWIMAAR